MEVKLELEHFKNIKDLNKLLGNGTTYSDKLAKVAHLKLKKFDGVFAFDTLPIKNGKYICNTDVITGFGKHWIAVYITSKQVYIYDSLGRVDETRKLQKLRRATMVDTDPEQKRHETNCGLHALSWLMLLEKHGIKNCMLL